MPKTRALRLHFDGDIAADHKISMRTLGKSLVHIQSALDRACLELTYGDLRKHARMPQHLWAQADLIVGPSQDGGYIIDFFQKNKTARAVVERFNLALQSAVGKMTSEGIERTRTVLDQVTDRRVQLSKNLVQPTTYEELVSSNDPKVIRSYGDRAMMREFDQVLSIIRSGAAGESSIEISLTAEKPGTYKFEKYDAQVFHTMISSRELGLPVLCNATVRALDKVSKLAKITHVQSGKQANLYFASEHDLLRLVPTFEDSQPIEFFASPWIEYGAYDPEAGDLMFVALKNRDQGT